MALAGVVSEYLRYGRAEGGLGDVRALDALMRALRFTQAKADGEVRWALLNAAELLRRHADTQVGGRGGEGDGRGPGFVGARGAGKLKPAPPQ